ncbi:MAG: prepilin-type N-terminal cleavage/methylation domain-containing protein [Nitrospiraceae bacterium]|nr:MAG: prepilin-type N-terminal cleavage/methylation domain-containing protein [Nitrospiraceae bacterium]
MRTQRGFTLIELLVVLFIIALAAGLIMPRLWDRGERALKSEARRIGNTLRYLHDESTGKKITYELKINVSGDSWEFASPKESRSFTMRESILFKDVIIPSLGEVTIGEVIMKFGPAGPGEPLIVHLMKDDLEYTVIYNHISGRAKIFEGYRL